MNAAGDALRQQSICVTCLSQDRKLFPVNGSKSHLFYLDLSEDDALCWECHFFVRKVAAFRSRAARAQALLASALHQTNEMEIKSLSSLMMMAPVLQEISLEPNYLLQGNVKMETLDKECTNTSYYIEIEHICINNDDESFEKIGDNPLLPVLNKQTEAKGDGGASTDMIDDDITDASSELLSVKDSLVQSQEHLCKLEPDDAPEYSQDCAWDEPTTSETLGHQFGPRSCAVELKPSPLGNLISNNTGPVIWDCNIKNKHVNQQAITHRNDVHAPDIQSRPIQTLNARKSYICDTCGKQFKYPSKLKRHLKIHTGEKPFVCDVDVCEKRYSRKSTLIAHLRKHHGQKPIVRLRKEKTFSCNICGKQLKSKAKLNLHCMIHTGEKPFVCDLCGKRFRQKVTLTCHLQTHNGEKSFSCHVCHKQFIHKLNLTEHAKTHSVCEKLFTCEICGKSSPSKRSLLLHVQSHKGERPFDCETCHKQFVSRFKLTEHKRTVHEGVKSFQCGVCQTWFKLKSHLGDHMLTHTDERPFSCNICDRRFRRKSHLVQHMRLHTGERPFCCDICQKRFTLKYNLISHLRLHTRKK